MEPSSAPWRVIDEAAPDPAVPAETGRPSAADAGPDPRRRWLTIGAAVVAIAVAVVAVVAAARPDAVVAVPGTTDAAGSPAVTDAAAPDSSTASGVDLVVEVGGAVRRPGVYRLAPGSRVGDAIESAGGYGPRVDSVAADRALNLARRLEDGDEIHVPSRDEAAVAAPTPGPGSSGGTPGGAGGLVDLNRASAEALDTLPGIGPATAAKIIAARTERPFRTLDELVSRKVISQAVLAKIRPLATVSG